MTDKDLLEEDPNSKKPALKMVIAQIENTRVGLIREILSLSRENAAIKGLIVLIEARLEAQDKYINKLIKIDLVFKFVLCICLAAGIVSRCFTNDTLTAILNKLTALGL